LAKALGRTSRTLAQDQNAKFGAGRLEAANFWLKFFAGLPELKLPVRLTFKLDLDAGMKSLTAMMLIVMGGGWWWPLY
jgi:hypothetical protein